LEHRHNPNPNLLNIVSLTLEKKKILKKEFLGYRHNPNPNLLNIENRHNPFLAFPLVLINFLTNLLKPITHLVVSLFIHWIFFKNKIKFQTMKSSNFIGHNIIIFKHTYTQAYSTPSVCYVMLVHYYNIHNLCLYIQLNFWYKLHTYFNVIILYLCAKDNLINNRKNDWFGHKLQIYKLTWTSFFL
jgi:hypothetical protein